MKIQQVFACGEIVETTKQRMDWSKETLFAHMALTGTVRWKLPVLDLKDIVMVLWYTLLLDWTEEDENYAKGIYQIPRANFFLFRGFDFFKGHCFDAVISQTCFDTFLKKIKDNSFEIGRP